MYNSNKKSYCKQKKGKVLEMYLIKFIIGKQPIY